MHTKIKSYTLVLLLTTACIHMGLAAPPSWTVNPADYQYNMTGVLRVMKANNVFMNEPNAMVGVFVGSETRGVVEGSDIIFIGNEAYFPVTMYSNQQVGETLNFEVYVPSLDSIFTVMETAIFDRTTSLGSAPDPFILSISMCDDILILQTDQSPLTGVYKARLEIILQGSIQIPEGMNLILDAPVIRSQNIFTLDVNSHLTIAKDGCG